MRPRFNAFRTWVWDRNHLIEGHSKTTRGRKSSRQGRVPVARHQGNEQQTKAKGVQCAKRLLQRRGAVVIRMPIPMPPSNCKVYEGPFRTAEFVNGVRLVYPMERTQ